MQLNLARVFNSRRAFTALFSISCLTLIALVNHTDTSMPIATIAVGLAASNSYQRKGSQADPAKLTDTTNG